MNPAYSIQVSFWIENGNTEPTSAQVEEIGKKMDTISTLLFPGKVLAPTSVDVHKDEDEQKDYTAYAEISVTLKASVEVTNQNPHDAECIAKGLLEDIGDYLYLSSCGVDLESGTVDEVRILNIEEDVKPAQES